ncbi:hypothetical protein ONS96_010621 [Cadophora gregata f. sp. sojae]|nr:hypothetical protein ONS96_010621 [Cadophora gregata f. sp. sojae]
MASILRGLFKSKASGTPNHRVKGHSYDSAIALDPPVKGSYPVAGNGPNVLEEIQRSRAQRDTSSARRQTSVAAAPNVPRYREDIIERPQTAPNDGTADGGRNKRNSKIGSATWSGRTRSGFSTKSPPSIFRSSSRNGRSNSINSTTEAPHASVPTPSTTPKPQTYQPKKGPGSVSGSSAAFTPPFGQHIRNESNASHRSYVDLLEAHSSIRPESSKHRAKASGIRNFGEDVADRNIDRFGAGSHTQLDLNSPQFSYMKTVYAPKKRPIADVAGAGTHSRVSSALGHVMGDDGPSDDIPPRSHRETPSIRTTTSASRSHPLRNETTPVVASSRSRDHDGASSSGAHPSNDRRARALSPLSQTNTAQSFDEDEPIMHNSHPGIIRPNEPSYDPRGQENVVQEPPPVATPVYKPKSPPPQGINQHTPTPTANHTVKRMPAMPPTNESAIHPSVSVKTNGHKKSKSRSVSYSTFPNVSNRPGNNNNNQTNQTEYAARSSSLSKNSKRQGMILENSSVPQNLDAVVDQSNTVDTDVTTKTLPAVTHEHVTPVRHEVREERVVREIHTHEVRHHVLPVLDTEILPTRHYVPSSDGKGLVEIPEPQVSKHKITGSMNGTWSLSKRPYSSRSRTSSLTHASIQQPQPPPPLNPEEYESAEAPVVGLARGDPKPRSRANSRASNHTVKTSRSLKNIFTEPILTSKKEYVTDEGYPRTEYVWRHQPVFEDATGRTQPVTMNAGILGDSNAPPQQFLEDGIPKEGKPRRSVDEESLLFRDSGYGSMGMLPGLSALAPMAGQGYKTDGGTVNELGRKTDSGRAADGGNVGNVKIASNAEGEATKALSRMRERSKSNVANKSAASSVRRASMPHVGDLVRGVDGLQM